MTAPASRMESVLILNSPATDEAVSACPLTHWRGCQQLQKSRRSRFKRFQFLHLYIHLSLMLGQHELLAGVSVCSGCHTSKQLLNQMPEQSVTLQNSGHFDMFEIWAAPKCAGLKSHAASMCDMYYVFVGNAKSIKLILIKRKKKNCSVNHSKPLQMQEIVPFDNRLTCDCLNMCICSVVWENVYI